MKINAEFDRRVVIHIQTMDWIDSPMPGVARRPLDRVGDEIARATSIVRYAPNSQFSPHVHTGGEEFLVLEGVFQDEHGDFPAGSYIRNPPQSSHTPSSQDGCVIFVKLWQFDPNDRTHIQRDTRAMHAAPHATKVGVSIVPLYSDEFEKVSIQHWAPHSEITVNATHGLEVLVLEGEFTAFDDTLVPHSWIRLPIGSIFETRTGTQGAKVWIKEGHLPLVDAQIDRVMSL